MLLSKSKCKCIYNIIWSYYIPIPMIMHALMHMILFFWVEWTTEGKREDKAKRISTLLLSVLFACHHTSSSESEVAAREDRGGKARQGICHASQQGP
jgi:hypothetical protein